MTAVFLDRDGVIIRKAPQGEYIRSWSEVQFLPGAIKALVSLYQAGLKIIVVTNQRGVALGRVTRESLEDIHAHLQAELLQSGVSIAEIYCCTHDLSAHCACRKPRPGMLLSAAQTHRLNLQNCWMVGDALSDVEAGKRAGCKTIMIRQDAGSWATALEPDFVVTDLSEGAHFILRLSNSKADSYV